MKISLESDPFCMSKFFISLITSALIVSLKENVLLLSKQLRTVTTPEWFSILAIIGSTHLVSEEFSLILRFLTILMKNSLNF